MSALVWVMMGIALWHFAIFVPDHFWSGIVGAFVGAVIGSMLLPFVIHGFTVPGQDDTTILAAIEAVPGAVIGMAVVYWIGMRQERTEAAAAH
jgi:outer membrane lipoprotein SlyB